MYIRIHTYTYKSYIIGFAMQRDLLSDIKFDAVLIEEAAEILPTHTLAALPQKGLKRMILIGTAL